MHPSRPATLEPVRFGEFLLLRQRISDEQWLAALAHHWSSPRRQKIGQTIIDIGFLPADLVEAEARVFHDEIEVVEVVPRADRSTMPMPLGRSRDRVLT